MVGDLHYNAPIMIELKKVFVSELSLLLEKLSTQVLFLI